MIELKNLSHSFGKKEPIFNKINLNIKKGHSHLLYGANGSGKTTLLKIIAGLLTPSTGDVLVSSLPPHHLDIKSKLTYIPAQTVGLFPRLTIEQNISFFAHALKVDNSEVLKKIKSWKEVIPFQNSLQTPFFQCSTGMKKLAIFFILTLHSPEILLIDELFENIDQETETQLALLLNTFFSDATIILSSHREMTAKLPSFAVWNLQGGSLVS